MTGHEDHAFTSHLVGDRDGLLGVAGVIADGQRQHLAVDATGGIYVCNCLFGAALHLCAERGVLTGHRAGNGDLDFGPSRAGHQEAERGTCQKYLFHESFLKHLPVPKAAPDRCRFPVPAVREVAPAYRISKPNSAGK